MIKASLYLVHLISGMRIHNRHTVFMDDEGLHDVIFQLF
ncbi:unnamed protein product [Acanthoscelides obtectus]|uniref:Uncharacterized protein n=1 Tax=Acanthoscelides obtectus TaxID=200917 RepID=A0A9P0NVZ7_ACAOB|nr:unnamed protein product [Acanthoscelides obtectus]CAK1679099.1 hypothetical protein AOBTE_LOCUS32127 [Acanthoscelides obtectus]